MLFFKRPPWSHSEDPSSNFTPAYKWTPPPNIEDDKNQRFGCPAPNWRMDHKCKGKQLYFCEIESDNDNDKNQKIIMKNPKNPKKSIHQNNKALRKKHLKKK